MSVVITLLVFGVSWVINRYSLAPQTLPPPQPSEFVSVVSVEDGDTITVQQDTKTEKVRLIGVDTPEVKDPRKPVQCYAQNASQFTTSLIGTNKVRLETDPEASDRDRYGRILRYIYLPDGSLVNAEIIKQGYGFAYLNFPFSKQAKFKQYQAEAEAAQQGLWRDCKVDQTSSGQQQTNAIN